MKIAIRPALLSDLDQLMPLMRGYYQDDGLAFDPVQATATMTRLLREPQWGRVLILQSDRDAVGYVAVCLGFSLELGGNDAFIDEVFVLPEYRGRGYGKQLLEAAADHAREMGVIALHLEVDHANESARKLYRSIG